jgi:2-oxoglutarate dehydrogenase E1 component
MSLAFVEGLYEDYLLDPTSVGEEWASYFESINGSSPKGVAPRLKTSFQPTSIFNPPGGNGAASLNSQLERQSILQNKVDNIVRNFRVRGHLMAQIDPLTPDVEELPEVQPGYHGIENHELDMEFSASYVGAERKATLRQIITRLRNTYCRSIGVQMLHIDDLDVRNWLQERMESTENRLELSRATQIKILTHLTDASMFEEFIQKKYPGAKSFSLEGAESFIPLLSLAIDKAGSSGVEEIILGMAHRGRLNVLANIMGKDPAQIFREYEDKDPDQYTGRGDVKYHLGYHSDWQTDEGRRVHLALCFNPSHLEFVPALACGRARSFQDRNDDFEHRRSMVIQIHGDASFAGEGIVQETLNLSGLGAYKTGGSLHVIINNQIGFTTNPEDSRSSPYCTDIARMLQSPIFHVNGEDPEAVAQVVDLALDFRAEYQRDVIIDMYCYRKRGHNEGDEPGFTQPIMYREIAKRKSVRESYLERLLGMGGVTREEADTIEVERRERLEKGLSEARSDPQVRPASVLRGLWSNYCGGPDVDVPDVDTGVEMDRLAHLSERLTTLPESFIPHPKALRIIETRAKMGKGEAPIDWAMGEALALASLATEGARIRMSGQDCQRGTFSHRHAVLFDNQTEAQHSTLQHLSDTQARVDIYNSPLSEMGVLAFEYGYSGAYPDGLIIWEAQFGDFVNTAQVILDQFISSAEDKWRVLSGLVMLLPHGFEGMGPEHSSARLERFLSLAAEDNYQVCIPTTPAQYFHLLRRQVVRPWRKPLIIMSPKSLLRHPKAVSTLDELSQGRFQRILPDAGGRIEGVSRIFLCSGKVYWDLEAEREKLGVEDIAILRVEQLYPLQPPDLEKILNPYKAETPVYWVQEEPENMGAWRRMKGKFGEHLLGRFPFTVVSRPASASPATGSAHSHRLEQQKLMDMAFGSEKTSWY